MSARLDQAFRLAAGELGMASAAWLFVAETAAAEGEAGVAALRDALGRAWPVLDAVCAVWAEGLREPQVDAGDVAGPLRGTERIVVVGLEALWLDALVESLPASVRLAVVQHGPFDTDWGRVRANHGERLEALHLDDFQTWAGPRSALLTFAYGTDAAGHTFVLPDWLRVSGPDVRTQFRALVGWNVLPLPLQVYPRWLVADAITGFTHLEPLVA